MPAYQKLADAPLSLWQQPRSDIRAGGRRVCARSHVLYSAHHTNDVEVSLDRPILDQPEARMEYRDRGVPKDFRYKGPCEVFGDILRELPVPSELNHWKNDESNAYQWKPEEAGCAYKSTSKFEGHNEHVKLMPFDFSNSDDYDDQPDSQYFWPNKLFIGGISPITTTDVLKGHFSRYGKVVDCVVMQKNGRPRGFGFVTFQDSGAADRVVMEPQILDGRMVDVKRAIPEQCQSLAHGLSMEAKIFVGGLGQTVTSELLALYFSNFGPVADAVVMRDKATTRSRGFGFVRFAAGEDGQLALEQVLSKYLDHRLEGKWIEVKKATPPGLSPPPKERPDSGFIPISTDPEQSESKLPWEEPCPWEGQVSAWEKDNLWKPFSNLEDILSCVPSPTRQKSTFSREDFLALELSTSCAQSIFA